MIAAHLSKKMHMRLRVYRDTHETCSRFSTSMTNRPIHYWVAVELAFRFISLVVRFLLLIINILFSNRFMFLLSSLRLVFRGRGERDHVVMYRNNPVYGNKITQKSERPQNKRENRENDDNEHKQCCRGRIRDSDFWDFASKILGKNQWQFSMKIFSFKMSFEICKNHVEIMPENSWFWLQESIP